MSEGGDGAGEGAGVALLEIPATGEIDLESVQAADVVGLHLAGSLPPLVLIRTWKFEVEKHRGLAAELGPDQPIYSVAPPRGERLEDYPRDVFEWRDLCLKRLAPLSTPKSHRLGGWSYGGVVALEVARELAARGEEVRLIALLDSRIPKRHPKTRHGRRSKTRLSDLAERLNEYVLLESAAEKRAWLLGRVRRRIEKLRGKLTKQWNRLRGRDVRRWRTRRAEESGPVYAGPGGLRMSLLKRTVRVTYLKYRPELTALPVAQYWTEQSLEGAEGDASLGWAAWLRGPLEVLPLPGAHHTMFDAPNVAVLAQALARSLARARD